MTLTITGDDGTQTMPEHLDQFVTFTPADKTDPTSPVSATLVKNTTIPQGYTASLSGTLDAALADAAPDLSSITLTPTTPPVHTAGADAGK